MMRERKKKQKADEKRQRRLDRKASEGEPAALEASSVDESEPNDSVGIGSDEIDA